MSLVLFRTHTHQHTIHLTSTLLSFVSQQSLPAVDPTKPKPSVGSNHSKHSFSWFFYSFSYTIHHIYPLNLYASLHRDTHKHKLSRPNRPLLTMPCSSFPPIVFCAQKGGRWNAMHVRIAWEIYHHQAKQNPDKSAPPGGSIGVKASSELLRPPSHIFAPPPPTASALPPSVNNSTVGSMAPSQPPLSGGGVGGSGGNSGGGGANMSGANSNNSTSGGPTSNPGGNGPPPQPPSVIGALPRPHDMSSAFPPSSALAAAAAAAAAAAGRPNPYETGPMPGSFLGGPSSHLGELNTKI